MIDLYQNSGVPRTNHTISFTTITKQVYSLQAHETDSIPFCVTAGFATGLARITCNDTSLLGNRDPPTVDYEHEIHIPATVGHTYILHLSDRYTTPPPPPPPSTNVLKTRSDRTNPELKFKGNTPLKEANLRKNTDYVKNNYFTEYTILNQ